MNLDTESPDVAQWPLILSKYMFVAVIMAGVFVGAYAIVNPNGIQFGAPWPVVSEVVAAIGATILGYSIRTYRRGGERPVLVVGIAVATIALILLGSVAFALMLNQT
jgi:hypothetical protein